MWIGVGLTTHFALSIVVPRYTLLWITVGAAGIGMPLYGLVDRNVFFQAFIVKCDIFLVSYIIHHGILEIMVIYSILKAVCLAFFSSAWLL